MSAPPAWNAPPSPLPDLRVFGDDPDTVHTAAVMFQTRGNASMALALFERLTGLVRPLAEARPEDRGLADRLAYCLNTLGNQFTAAGFPDRAVSVLEELEGIYRHWSPPGPSSAIADVLIRRGVAQATRGFWASAPVDLDAAVTEYRQLGRQGGVAFQADLARVLMRNAEILEAAGDPDLAAGSADQAVRVHLWLAQQAYLRPGVNADSRRLAAAAHFAARLHGEHGRIETALQADNIAVSVLEPLVAAGSRDQTATLVAALVQRSVHLWVSGDPARSKADEARASKLDGVAAQQALAALARESRDTLADTLEKAAALLGPGRVPDILTSTLTDPAGQGAMAVPSDRCLPQLAPSFAMMLADTALALLPRAKELALRLGLEAHYLFAAAARERTSAVSHKFVEFGPAWARLLTECSEAAASGEGMSFVALDLAGWAYRVAARLAPFARADQGVGDLVATCFARSGRMFAGSGDIGMAGRVQAEAQAFNESRAATGVADA